MKSKRSQQYRFSLNLLDYVLSKFDERIFRKQITIEEFRAIIAHIRKIFNNYTIFRYTSFLS